MEGLIVEYAPLLLIVTLFLIRNKFVATPSDLTNLRISIINEIKADYATKEAVTDIKNDITEIKQEIKQLNQFLMKKFSKENHQ